MSRRRVLMLAILASFAVWPALAQEPGCPAEQVCIEYGADTFAIDPDDGFYQLLVVEERTITVRDFDGERVEAKVTLLPLTENGDTFELGELRIVKQEGIFADAELGDTFGLREIS